MVRAQSAQNNPLAGTKMEHWLKMGELVKSSHKSEAAVYKRSKKQPF